MIKVYIPDNNINERIYIVNVLIGEFLGLDYEIIKSNKISWEIEIENGSKLIIQDYFFNKYKNDLEYLKLENIPLSINYGQKNNNQFLPEDNIPIIFGEDKILFNNSKEKTIICGIDIFASSFFMLTRWEEYVNNERDKHKRFPASESLAFKYNFLNRPVVNEYVEMLWNMLNFLGTNQKRNKDEYKIILTHDVDIAYRYSSIKSGLGSIVSDIIKRKNIGLFYNNFKNKIKVHLKIEKDPFDTYDYLMDVSNKYSAKSYFFLHSSTASKYDSDNYKYLVKIAKKIKENGHFIGYHPSYNAYNNLALFKKEKKKIEDIIGENLVFGRQHFLRFEVPTTWQIWEDANMEWDSTLSYADKEGFRCGCCYPYSVFNFLTRKKLQLKERPLIVMEGSIVNYQPEIDPDTMEKKICSLKEKVKKYNGEFILLWHNSSFNSETWTPYEKVYENIIKY